MEIDHTCANPACDCRVEKKGDYCSDTCRQHEATGSQDPCTCGHVDCGTSTPDTHGVPDQNADH